MTANMDLVLGMLPNPAEGLRQSDVIAARTYARHMGRRDFTAAFDSMARHLMLTEVTRRQVHGAPSYHDALVAFEDAVVRHMVAGIRLGTVSDPLPDISDAHARRILAGPKPAPVVLPDVDGPEVLWQAPTCGHVRALGRGMTCYLDPHPDNPGGHAYRSSDGSDVASKHGAEQREDF